MNPPLEVPSVRISRRSGYIPTGLSSHPAGELEGAEGSRMCACVGVCWEGSAVRSSRGFTLVELLVVMAIIAMLAGILFPVLRQAQDTARMRECMSNLRQLGQAFSLYLDDNYGFAIPAPAPADWCLRPDPLAKYVKQSLPLPSETYPRRLWICPGDRGYGNEPPRWRYNGLALSSYLYPYGAYLATIDHIDVRGGATAVNAPRRPDQWARPTRDPLLCDWSPNFHMGRKDESTLASPDDAVKCINFLMLDGHVVSGTRWDRMEGYVKYAVIYDNPFSWGYNPGIVLRR